MKSNGKKILTDKIVRNYFDAILNPIYESLKNAIELLREGNYTWEPFGKQMIEIGVFSSYFDIRYLPNYEQLISTEFPELKEISINYDKKRNDLNNACSELFNVLTSSDDLRALLMKKIDEYEKIGLLTKHNAEYARSVDSVNWVGKYLINNIKLLPESHILYSIWNTESELFFKFLFDDDIFPLKDKLDNCSNAFLEIALSSFETIKNKNSELSLKYGVPIVEFAVR